MARRIIGLAREATYGTYQAPVILLPGTVDDGFEQEFIRDETPYGGRLMPAADLGRINISVSINDIDVRADYLAWILRAAYGAPTTTGAAAPFTHQFRRPAANAAGNRALDGFSIHVEIDETRYAFRGCLLQSFTLNADTEGRLKLNTEWLARDVLDNPAAAALTPLTQQVYTFRHTAHQRAAVAYNNINTLSINANNNITSIALQDGSSVLGGTSLGRHEVEVEMEVIGSDTLLMSDWVAGAPVAWTFDWNAAANNRFTVSIPRLRTTRPTQNLGGFDIATKSVTGVAEFDAATATEATFTVVNTVSSYA